MAERVCNTCGTSTDGTEVFCRVCDTYLGWSVNAQTAPSAAPPDTEPVGAGAGATPPGQPPRPGPPSGGRPDPSARPGPPPRPDRVLAPVASVKQAEVTVSPTEPGVFEVDVKNDSTIVDSYQLHAADPPAWLTVSHEEANLLPGVLRTVRVTFSVTPGQVAVAQRLTVPLFVRSSVDTTRATPLSIDVVVPRSGPAAIVVAQPNLIRLEDATEGGFRLLLDNRAANFERQYRLSGTDPEGVVRLEFLPPAVDLPPGGTAEATVRFSAPAPPPGKEMSRQLTITATDPDGTVAVPVTLAQSTSAPPESLPVRLRLEPSQVALLDATTAEVSVVIDNRGGHERVKLNISGRDPRNLVGFHFDHTRVAVEPGSLGYLRLRLQTPPAQRGQTESRPFTVVGVADDGREIEAAGTLELASRADPITTARLWMQPEHLMTRGRKGTYAVDVDNRQGADVLHVQLAGADEFGRARLAFNPQVLSVPPGQVGRATLVVEHPRPAPGPPSARRIEVRATSHSGFVEAEATFTQQAESYRRLWGILLVLLGAAALLTGLFLWATDPDLPGVTDAAARLVDNVRDQDSPSALDIVTVVVGVFLAMAFLSTLLMLLGLTGSTGRLVRVSAVFAVLWALAVLVAAPFADFIGFGVGSFTFAIGALALVVGGAAAGFAGGVLIRR